MVKSVSLLLSKASAGGIGSGGGGGSSNGRARSNSAKGLTGPAFEQWVADKYEGSLIDWVSGTHGGRDFDVRYGNTLVEAKSGGYWNLPQSEMERFKSKAGQQVRIARELGLQFEVHSNSLIPQTMKDWLTKMGISYVEHLD